MIVPRIVSHVQPTGRDYGDRTAPDLITSVPTPNEAREWAAEQAMRRVVTLASLRRYYSIGLKATEIHLTKLTGV